MRRRLNRIACCLWLIVLCSATAAVAGPQPFYADDLPRHALVVGNWDYTEVAPLKNARNDATAVRDKLAALGFEVDYRRNLDRREFSRAIAEFGDTLRQHKGVGLFYYAGHGVEVDGVSYLVPLGTAVYDKQDIEHEAIQVRRLLRHMERGGSALRLLIIDACRDDPFDDNSRSLFGGESRGISRIDSAPGETFIAAATASGTRASDGDGDGAHSPYTAALLEAIDQPELSLEGVFKNVREQVLASTRGKQIPWETTSLTKQFYFVRAGNVTIDSIPSGANLYLDNKILGLAPLKTRLVAGRSFRVEARLSGYEPTRQDFELMPGDQRELLIELTKSAAEPLAQGSLYIKTEPAGAEISIDGAQLGAAPYTLDKLEPNRGYRITAHLQSFKPLTRDVWVSPGDANSVVLTLEPVIVSLNTTPTEHRDMLEDTPGPLLVLLEPAAQHRQLSEIQPLYIGKYEVTVGDFAKFVTSTGYQTDAEKTHPQDGHPNGCYTRDTSGFQRKPSYSWRNPGFRQRRNHPVVCVSWRDAVAYVLWLRGQTGRDYRLPNGKEWEYAARAGSTEKRFWGDDPNQSCLYANLLDLSVTMEDTSKTIHHCNDGHPNTAPVGAYQANGFGLHDMIGNAAEWVCTEGNCVGESTASTLVRGGGWYFQPDGADLNFSAELPSHMRMDSLGFRVALNREEVNREP